MKTDYLIVATAVLILAGCATERPISALSNEYQKKTSIEGDDLNRKEIETIYLNDDKILEVRKVSSRQENGWGNPNIFQRVFWNGREVFMMITPQNPEWDIQTKISSPAEVEVSITLSKTGGASYISLDSESGKTLCAFDVINGVLHPLPVAEIEKCNQVFSELKPIFSDFIEGKTTGDEFSNQIESFQKKHNQK